MLSIIRQSGIIRLIKSVATAKTDAAEARRINNYRWDYASDEGLINRFKLQIQQWNRIENLSIFAKWVLIKKMILRQLWEGLKRGRFVWFHKINGTHYSNIWTRRHPLTITCRYTQYQNGRRPMNVSKERWIWSDKFDGDLDMEIPY
mgnify:FL=1|jgi:hypothetical protein|tara:strand:+ start:1860 stop:2300 length:441 start_codon:yes stop_codon:yes gene_type:complete